MTRCHEFGVSPSLRITSGRFSPADFPLWNAAIYVSDCFPSFPSIYLSSADRTLTADHVTIGGACSMRTKLTPAFCQRATAEPGAERTLFWDAEMPGFGLVVTGTGHRSYVVQYRTTGRRSRRMTIDGVLGLAAARKRARSLLGEVANDRDPLRERRKAAARQENTLPSIAEEYLSREGKKPRTAASRAAW